MRRPQRGTATATSQQTRMYTRQSTSISTTKGKTGCNVVKRQPPPKQLVRKNKNARKVEPECEEAPPVRRTRSQMMKIDAGVSKPATVAPRRTRSQTSKIESAQPDIATSASRKRRRVSRSPTLPCQCEHITSTKVKLLPEKVKTELLNPKGWHCAECGTTDGIWACLTCGHIACGREQGAHAFQHFKSTKHAFVINIGSKYVHCYHCDDYVANDTTHDDLADIRQLLADTEQPQLSSQKRTRSGRKFAAKSMDVISAEDRAKMDNNDKLHTAMFRWRYMALSKAWNAWRAYIHSKGSEATKPIKAKPARSMLVPGIAGLRNLGQTCYMNAVLQCLGHVAVFRNELYNLDQAGLLVGPDASAKNGVKATTATPAGKGSLLKRRSTLDCRSLTETRPAMLAKRRRARGDIEEESDDGNTVLICRDLCALYRVLWSGKYSVVTPYSVLCDVWRLNVDFSGYKQQDPQELLYVIQMRMIEELDERLKKRNVDRPSKQLLGRFSDLMKGRLGSTVTCKHCKAVSTSEAEFHDLSLDVPVDVGDESVNLLDILSSFEADEEIAEYACEKCCKSTKVHQSATKRYQILKTGALLCLHLKRFMWSGTRREKIHTFVKFPFEIHSVGATKALYQLVGVIVHEGKGMNSGHYSSFCLNPHDREWYHFNDARVALSAAEIVAESQAYILFYENMK